MKPKERGSESDLDEVLAATDVAVAPHGRANADSQVDADLGRPRRDYTSEEDDFRDEVEGELKTAHERGERLEFTSELP